MRAPAQLHQAAGGQAAEGDATGHGRVDQRAGRGAHALVFVQLVQLGNGGVGIKRRVVQRGLDQRFGTAPWPAAHGFFGVFDHDLEGAVLHRLVRAAEGDGAAGLGLQGQAGDFQHMGQGQGVVHALGLAGCRWRESAHAACLQSRAWR